MNLNFFSGAKILRKTNTCVIFLHFPCKTMSKRLHVTPPPYTVDAS